MSAVDLSDPSGIPVTGVYTSENGSVNLNGRELMKVTQATLRIDNGLGVFRPCGTRVGSVYAGNQRVTGQITRALLNFAEIRLLMGSQPGWTELGGQQFQPGPGVLNVDQMNALFGSATNKVFPADEAVDHFYPFRVDIELVVNRWRRAVVTTDDQDGMTDEDAKWTESSIYAKNCIINNYVIAYNSRGHIISGPLNYIGSAIQWKTHVT